MPRLDSLAKGSYWQLREAKLSGPRVLLVLVEGLSVRDGVEGVGVETLVKKYK